MLRYVLQDFYPVLRRLPSRCAAPLAFAVLRRAAPRGGEQLLVRRVLPCLGTSLHWPGAWGAPFEGTKGCKKREGGILGAWWDLITIYMYLWSSPDFRSHVLLTLVVSLFKETHDSWWQSQGCKNMHPLPSTTVIVSCWSTACWLDHTKWRVNLRLPMQEDKFA